MIENYAINNQNNIYIYDTSLTFRYNPFVIYSGKYPSNMFFWGGMGWNSPTFYTQLQMNNLTELYSTVFFEDNVYYISRNNYYISDNLKLSDVFFEYMIETYGDIDVNITEHLDNNIDVYKLSKRER